MWHSIWPQDDIRAYRLNEDSHEDRVLIASRSSAFKDSVVARIREAFDGKPVHVRFTGVDGLRHENAATYQAVVLISTCMVWKLDPDVEAFLRRSPDQSHIIVLATSNVGDWRPGMKDGHFDSIASASKSVNVDGVSGYIISRINTLLGQP
jgi:hypothetical protein